MGLFGFKVSEESRENNPGTRADFDLQRPDLVILLASQAHILKPLQCGDLPNSSSCGVSQSPGPPDVIVIDQAY